MSSPSPGADPVPPARPPSTPVPLLVAAVVAAVQGVVTLLVGAADLVSLGHGRLVMGVTTALFFAAYAVGLVVCAWGLSRRATWSRGLVLMAQLVWLGLAWSWRSTATLPAAVLAVSAVVALVGLLHPASLAALDRAAGTEN